MTWRQIRQERLNQVLIVAVDRNDVAVVRRALRAGANPNARKASAPLPRGFVPWMRYWFHPQPDTHTGDPALTLAAWKGEAEIVQLLITAGANVNASFRVDREIETPLLGALYSRRPQQSGIVAKLLSAGANPNPNRLDASQMSPLEQAVHDDSAIVVRMLLQHGAHFDPRTQKGRDLVFSFAVENHDAGVMESLLDGGVDPNVQDVNDRSLLIAAQNNVPVVKLLLQRGVKVNFKDDHGSGSTALGWAEMLRRRQWRVPEDCKAWDAVIALLKAYGGKP